ncbi:IS5 family transposase [Rhizobium rhizosphaerae]|uniref:IS5 family transposase n=1 Tax=Xaviernesmea rhizosphaerae TaxID=1672749 RepID=A0A1Q9AGY3_9HYPH|nr:IS5 family transposase [Xaviernesmea rhizosphaerae]OLP54382.1 IS5 family transposase [Xaviernesmea rhizosphaerae]
MRPRERRDSRQADLFRARLDQIVDMNHPLAKLGRAIDWRFLETRCGSAYSDTPGHPPLPTRLMAGLAILKSMHNLSDEALCDRWVENPYYQLFCGEEFFRHDLPFDRSSMTRWRQRMGEETLNALLDESLATAIRTEAAKPADFTKAIVDTTLQPKAVAHPTDAWLMHRARERLVRRAGKLGIALRQSYARVGKHALIKHQRYAHAKQFKRAGKSLRSLKTYLGRVIRDIIRKARGNPELEAATANALMLARRVHAGNRNLNRIKGKDKDADLRVFSLHAPEVECIGKGKTHKPYEFGVKVSVATTLNRSKGGQFVTHIQAMPGKPYDGHTLETIIPAIETRVGATLTRIVADAGYKGHNAPRTHRLKVFTSGQKRGVTDRIKREMRRRSAVEPLIGHLKAGHRMGRNHLAHAQGDAANAVLAAIGYNYRRILAWLRLLFAVLCVSVAGGRATNSSAQVG